MEQSINILDKYKCKCFIRLYIIEGEHDGYTFFYDDTDDDVHCDMSNRLGEKFIRGNQTLYSSSHTN